MKWITTAQLCKLYGGIPYTYVYRWNALGYIPYVRVRDKANGSDPVLRYPEDLAVQLLAIWEGEANDGPIRFRFGLPDVTRAVDAFVAAHPEVPWYALDRSVQ